MSPNLASPEPASANQSRLIEALRDPACYPHAVESIRILETHISFVILTGAFAYKIKKSVDLGFLDFTTLEKRRRYCDEELRLNSRLAPEIYLDVVAVCGTPDAPRMGDGENILEYAVRMREFPQDALADRMLARGELSARHIDGLAACIAAFHERATPAREGDHYGAPEAILDSVAQNFSQIRALQPGPRQLGVVDELERWSRREHKRLREVYRQRMRDGRVRECHGDLHLGNVVLLDGQPRLFDCIEFNAQLRWIDVMNEVAFLVMDLQAAGRPDFAARLLNGYLESTGDYGALTVLRGYLVYRAMVRAKVSLMRARQLQPGAAEATALGKQFRHYLALALSRIRPPQAFVLITHGISGCGKTTLSQPLLEMTGAIRLRSDVERKRIHGLAPLQRSGSGIGEGLYRPDATESTYARLLDLARLAVESGHAVIVDATFLQREQREMFRALAQRARVAFAIVDFNAGVDLLRQRVLARSQGDSDASEADLAVLEHQLSVQQPLEADELEAVFAYDASRPVELAQRRRTWAPLFKRLMLASGGLRGMAAASGR